MALSRRGLGSRSHFSEQFAKRFPGGAAVGRLLDQALDNARAVAVGLPRKHQETHLTTGADPLQTPGTPRAVTLNVAGVIGAGPSLAREDHGHSVDLLLTAKGDSLTKSDASTYIREAVGANDTVHMADSAQTTGRVWATIATILGKILTTKGDLLTRDGSTVVRKGVGADALQVTAVASEADGLRWGPLVLSPAQIVANTNDYAPGRANVYRLTSDASRNITGLVAGTDGEVRRIFNVGSFGIVLTHQDAASTAVNRFICTGAGNITILPDEGAVIVYDGTTQRWRAAPWA